MEKRSIQTIVLIFAVGVISTITSFTIASGENLEQDSIPFTPKYSEKCAHGHNGFDCKEPSYRTDITDLQKRVSELEKNHKFQ